jgi:hypothetical protein
MRVTIPPLLVLALTELHERIRKIQLKTLRKIVRKKISIPALGSYFTRITGPISRLTTIPSHTTTPADQNGAWKIRNTDKSIF